MDTLSSSSDRLLESYIINDPADTAELVERIGDNRDLFEGISMDWKYWFASHPEHLGDTLTASLVYQTGLPDVIHFLPIHLKK